MFKIIITYFFVFYIVGILSSISTNNIARLDCLQTSYGNNINDTDIKLDHWIRGKVCDKLQKEAWIYNKLLCPLVKFDAKEFCLKSISCGSKVLFVGDSTIQHLFRSSSFILHSKKAKYDCPTLNNCNISSGIRQHSIKTHDLHGCYTGKYIICSICYSYL
jgi:hypothetical protein